MSSPREAGKIENVRGLDVPSTQIELDHRDKSLHGVIDRRHGKKGFGVRHEAA
jgi:hypothetical protein